MLLKLPIMLWNNALDSSLYYTQIVLHKFDITLLLSWLHLQNLTLFMNVTPVFLLILQHQVPSTQELFTSRSSKCLWNQASSCIIVEWVYNHGYAILKMILKMKLVPHAGNLAYYASIMLDAFSYLLFPKLYWHNTHKPIQ